MQPITPHALILASVIAADAFVAALWQGLVLAFAVALLLRLSPGLAARTRSLLWISVLLLIVLLPAISLLLPGAHDAAPSHPGPVHLSTSWSFALACVWIAVSLVRLGQLMRSALRLQRISKRALPMEPGAAVAHLLRRATRHAQLCTSADVTRPSVVGFFHPRILLPTELLNRLSAAQLEHIVLHEMEHLRRRDDWTNLLQKLALAVFPLNPVLLWLDRRLSVERELACDDGVLRVTHARKAYAECLVDLATHSLLPSSLSLALGAWGRRSDLTHRVHSILSQPNPTMSPRRQSATAGILLAAALSATVMLAGTPPLVSFAPSALRPSAILPSAMPQGDARQESAQVSAPAIATPSPTHPILPRATEVRAILPQRRTPSLLQVSAETSTRLKPSAKPISKRVAKLRRRTPTPWVLLTATPPTDTRAHLVLALENQDLQSTFAAVPIQNGWLIFQL